jgi:hypothetical protein
MSPVVDVPHSGGFQRLSIYLSRLVKAAFNSQTNIISNRINCFNKTGHCRSQHVAWAT